MMGPYLLWNRCGKGVVSKDKVLFWLLIHNRLNTRTLLQRKNLWWMTILVSCVTNGSWKQVIIYSSNAPLLFYAGNIFVLSRFPPWACSWTVWSSRGILSSLKLSIFKPFLWRLSCWLPGPYRSCTMIFSSRLLLLVSTDVGKSLKMSLPF
jgi:hypothetical protein